MTVYRGVYFHPRQQTVCFCNSAGGEVSLAELRHDRDDLRGFYSQLTGEVVVGLEASGYSSRSRRRFAAAPGAGRRMSAGTSRSSSTCCCGAGSCKSTARPPRVRRCCGCCAPVQMRTRAENSPQALCYGAGPPRRAHLLIQKWRERLCAGVRRNILDNGRGKSIFATEPARYKAWRRLPGRVFGRRAGTCCG